MNINPSRLSTVLFSWIEALETWGDITVLHSSLIASVFQSWLMTFAIFPLTFLMALWLALEDEILLKLFTLMGMFNKNFFIFYFSFIDNKAYSHVRTAPLMIILPPYFFKNISKKLSALYLMTKSDKTPSFYFHILQLSQSQLTFCLYNYQNYNNNFSLFGFSDTFQ